MIASFTRDFIFVKTRKTGGTSAEIVLSGWCRDPDICTPISPDDEAIRQAFGGAARNFASAGPERDFYNHMPAAEIARRLPELWGMAFRFAIERHPYEKVVSRAWWNLAKRGGNATTELPGEIERTIATRGYLDRHLYCVDGAVAVDEVIEHARIEPRLAALAARLGTHMPARLPRAKGGHRLDDRPARDILGADQRATIARDAAFEFELMGYER